MSRRLRVRHEAHCTFVTPWTPQPAAPGTVELAYEVHGSGPQNVLFIPGMCVSRKMWQHQLDALLGQPQYTLCLLDNRGSGLSGASRTGGYDMRTMARDALAVADAAFGRRARLHVVGHSMGSMIAQRVALIAAEAGQVQRIASLSLLSGHDGGWFWSSFPTGQMVKAAWDLLLTGFEEGVTAAVHMRLHYTESFLNENMLCGETGEKVSRRSVYFSRYLAGIREERRQEGGGDTFWGHLAAVRSHNLTKAEARTLRRADFAKMIVYGEDDRVVLPRASKELASRIGGVAVGVRGAHFVIDEAKYDVNKLLLVNFRRGSEVGPNDSFLAPGFDGRLVPVEGCVGYVV